MSFEEFLQKKKHLTEGAYKCLSLAEQTKVRIEWENYCEGFDEDWDDEMDFAWKTGTLYV